jgi:hypothetical protein
VSSLRKLRVAFKGIEEASKMDTTESSWYQCCCCQCLLRKTMLTSHFVERVVYFKADETGAEIYTWHDLLGISLIMFGKTESSV